MPNKHRLIFFKKWSFTKIILYIVLTLYYLYLLFPIINFYNYPSHPNRAYVLIFVFAFFSILGILLASSYKKNYDILFLLLFKIFSYFPSLYIAILEGEVFNAPSLCVLIHLQSAMTILINSFFTIASADSIFSQILLMFWLLPVYMALSIVPFILTRILKKEIHT